MSELTTGTVEPATVAETAQPEVVQKDEPVPTTTVKTGESSGNDWDMVEPHNDLTKNFTDAEWKGVKELRVSNITVMEKNELMVLFRRKYLKSLKRFTDRRTLELRSGVSN